MCIFPHTDEGLQDSPVPLVIVVAFFSGRGKLAWIDGGCGKPAKGRVFGQVIRSILCTKDRAVGRFMRFRTTPLFGDKDILIAFYTIHVLFPAFLLSLIRQLSEDAADCIFNVHVPLILNAFFQPLRLSQPT